MTQPGPKTKESVEREHVYCETCGDRMIWAPSGHKFDRKTGARIVIKQWCCANTALESELLHDVEVVEVYETDKVQQSIGPPTPPPPHTDTVMRLNDFGSIFRRKRVLEP